MFIIVCNNLGSGRSNISLCGYMWVVVTLSSLECPGHISLKRDDKDEFDLTIINDMDHVCG